MSKNKTDTAFIILNTEAFNKYLLTISTSSFPALYYMISQGKGYILGFKISLAFFGMALFLTMFALIIVIDDPNPKGCKDLFIYCIDWVAFILFSFAILITYISICAL